MCVDGGCVCGCGCVGGVCVWGCMCGGGGCVCGGGCVGVDVCAGMGGTCSLPSVLGVVRSGSVCWVLYRVIWCTKCCTCLYRSVQCTCAFHPASLNFLRFYFS